MAKVMANAPYPPKMRDLRASLADGAEVLPGIGAMGRKSRKKSLIFVASFLSENSP